MTRFRVALYKFCITLILELIMHRFSTNFFCFTLIAIIAYASNCRSQQLSRDPSFRSSHQNGDTLQLLPNEEGYGCQILVFVDASTCFTCDQALNTFTIFEQKYHVPITIFMEGEIQNYADSQKTRSGWPFAVIGDPLHLYEKAYGVIAPPYYFLTDHNGKIIALDKLAGVNFSMDSLRSLILDAENNQSFGQSSSLPVIKEITLSDSFGTPLVIGRKNFIVPFVNRSMIAILDGSLKILYLADSTGHIDRKFDLKDFPSTPSAVSWYITDRELLIRFPSWTTNCLLYALDIESCRFRPIHYDAGAIPKGCRMPKAWINPVSGLIYGNLLPKQGLVAVNPGQPTVIVFDSSGHFLRSFGKPAQSLTTHIVSLVAESYFGFDTDGNLYELESPSSALNIYGSRGNLINHISLKFGDKWKPYTTNIPADPDMNFWTKLNINTSWERNLLIAPADSQAAVVYVNTKYNNGDTDPHSSDAILTYYLHLVHSPYSKGDDIALPTNTVPVALYKDYFIASRYQGNHLNLLWFDLKKVKE